jgi:hypothetical protein
MPLPVRMMKFLQTMPTLMDFDITIGHLNQHNADTRVGFFQPK